MFRTFGSQRGDHQDLGGGRLRQHFGQGFEPAHAGHFEIQHDHVDLPYAKFLQAFFSGAGCSNHIDIGFLGEHARKNGTHGQRIVDQHDLYPAILRLGFGNFIGFWA